MLLLKYITKGLVIRLVIILCVLIGFLSAFIGSLVGLGGGVILVPAMLILYENLSSFAWANPQTIVGISLVTMVFTGLSSTIAYYQQRKVDIKTGVTFLIGSIPGGIFGSWVNTQLDVANFSLYFGILMIFIFSLMLVDRNKLVKDKPIKITKYTRTFELEGNTYQYNVPYIPAIFLAFVVGTLSGLFGIGGGTISVPAMMLFFGIPVQVAVATSMFMIFAVSIFSSSTHIFFGHIAWTYVIFFIIGSYLGGTFGAKTSKLLKGRTLEWILRIVILIVAIRFIVQSIV